MSKAKNPKYKTGKARASYPFFNKPDTKFDEDGVYKADLVMTEEVAQPLIDAIDARLKDFIQELQDRTKKKQDPKKFRVPYEYTEDGKVLIKVKQSAQFEGEPVKLLIYDSKGKLIANPPIIRSGSEVKVAGTIRTYESGANKGITLSISAVQIITLANGSGGDVEDGSRFGFEEEEDGFDGSQANTFEDDPEDLDPEATDEELDDDL